METASAGFHHETTHTLICMEQIYRSRYYVTEGDLDCLLWRSVREVQEGNSVGLELNDEKVSPLIDVIDAFRNGAREHEQHMLEVGIQFSVWSLGGGVFNLHTREVSAQWMNEARSAIAREMRTVRMSKLMSHSILLHMFSN